ncbi:MAG: hypothetical protein ABSH01_25950 [Terriglobia bacterium]
MTSQKNRCRVSGVRCQARHSSLVTARRYGGAITGAMFVGEFAGDTPWVHLDIAGTRWSNEEKPFMAKGPTGHGVRALVQLLTDISE